MCRDIVGHNIGDAFVTEKVLKEKNKKMKMA